MSFAFSVKMFGKLNWIFRLGCAREDNDDYESHGRLWRNKNAYNFGCESVECRTSNNSHFKSIQNQIEWSEPVKHLINCTNNSTLECHCNYDGTNEKSTKLKYQFIWLPFLFLNKKVGKAWWGEGGGMMRNEGRGGRIREIGMFVSV